MDFSDKLRAKDWTFAATSRLAQRRRTIALYILIASLGMFFGAALLGYLMVRLRGETMPPMDIPPILWVSTVLAIVGGGFLWASLRSIRRERQRQFRTRLLIAFMLGIGFCTTQTIGLTFLMREHQRTTAELAAWREETQRPERLPEIVIPGAGLRSDREQSGPAQMTPPRNEPPAVLEPIDRRLEGLVFVLVGLHALHFLGGMVALAIVTWRGLSGRYDHEYHGGLYLCAIYWRFLDVVWITLFAAFLLTD